MAEELEDRVRKLEGDVSSVKVNQASMAANLEAVKSDTTSIKTDVRWVVRIVFGAVILAIVGFALKGGFVVPG